MTKRLKSADSNPGGASTFFLETRSLQSGAHGRLYFRLFLLLLLCHESSIDTVRRRLDDVLDVAELGGRQIVVVHHAMLKFDSLRDVLNRKPYFLKCDLSMMIFTQNI